MHATKELAENAPTPKAPTSIDIPNGLEALARRYILSRQKELSVFEESLEQSDYEGIRRMSHNLKGTGASYGFAEISRVGAAMERAAKEQNRIDISDQMSALSRYVLAAVEQLV